MVYERRLQVKLDVPREHHEDLKETFYQFNIYYEEEHEEGDTWKCRWDRHPNGHNQRGHFHTPPDASTPGEDLSYAKDWRDVISLVLDELDNHIQGFWRD